MAHPGRRSRPPDQAQAALDRLCVRLDGRKRVRDDITTTVGALADAEELRPVPAHYPAVLEVGRTVSNQARISFRGNTYSVPPGHTGRRLLVRHRLGEAHLEVLTDTGVVLARHRRAPDGAGAVVCAARACGGLEKVVLANFADRPPCRANTGVTDGGGAGRGRPHPRQGSGTRGSAGGGRHRGRLLEALLGVEVETRTAGQTARLAGLPPGRQNGRPGAAPAGRRATSRAPRRRNGRSARGPARRGPRIGGDVAASRPRPVAGTAGDKTYQVVRGKTKDGRLTWMTTLQISDDASSRSKSSPAQMDARYSAGHCTILTPAPPSTSSATRTRPRKFKSTTSRCRMRGRRAHNSVDASQPSVLRQKLAE